MGRGRYPSRMRRLALGRPPVREGNAPTRLCAGFPAVWLRESDLPGKGSAGLLVQSVVFAERTELFELQPVPCVQSVLSGRVVAALALFTRKGHNHPLLACHCSLLSCVPFLRARASLVLCRSGNRNRPTSCRRGCLGRTIYAVECGYRLRLLSIVELSCRAYLGTGRDSRRPVLRAFGP
jgi:hypothetical protein